MIQFFVTLAVTAGLTAPVRALMARRGAMDKPNHRSSHTQPTPRGGGIACFAGVILGFVLAPVNVSASWTVVGCTLLVALGLADDLHKISPVARLVGQSVSGAILGLAGGRPGTVIAGAVVTVVLVNVVNFMDGINGLTSLTMTVWGMNAWFVGSQSSNVPLATLGSLGAAAALGFMPWNAIKARIFLGDSGSYLFGAIVAAGLLSSIDKVGGSANAGWQSLIAILLPLMIYFVDTGSVLIRRAAKGEPIMEAHRQHVYQILSGDLRLGHLPVSIFVALLSLGVSLLWLADPSSITVGLLALTAVVYISAPKLVRKLAVA